MLRPNRLIRLFLLAVGVGLLEFAGISAQLSAQTDTKAPALQMTQAPMSPDAEFKVTRLQVAQAEMREFLKKMRVLAVNYHMADDPREVSNLGAEWRKMLVVGHRTHDKLVEAAVADFREKPELESPACQLIAHITGRNADADRIDGMFELVQLLEKHGQTGQSFDLCFGLTAAGNNQYAAARPHLDAASKNLEEGLKELAETKKLPDEERQKIAKKFIETYDLLKDLSETERYEQLWKEELAAREADAAGEPLPRVLITTTKGDFTLELFENQAPNTVASFISLCEKDFYNGLPFHRVLSHFMAQGGDPQRDGTGGPGYTIPTELNGTTDRKFFRGTVAMAMSSLPDSGGSQFFVCYMPRANLNGKYVAFGRVVEGMNTLSDFARIDPEDKEQEHSQELPDEIISTKVLRKRAHEYTFKKSSVEHDHKH